MNEANEALLIACRCGDRKAWARLYQTNAPTVALFLQRLLGPDRDLEDRVQEVFVEFFTTLDRFRGEGSLATWLYGIASFVAARHRRFEFRWRRRRTAYGEWIATQSIAHSDPAVRAEARAVLKCVADVLDAMDLKQRTVWVLREWEGLSTAEVAAALQVPEGTVRFRLCMARRALSESLATAGLDASPLADGESTPAVVIRHFGPAAGR